MDTMGALALATEDPSPEVLNRLPYKRTALLVSRPMWRNIFCQSAFQLTLLFVLLFNGADLFQLKHGSGEWCKRWEVVGGEKYFDAATGNDAESTALNTITCEAFESICQRGKDTYNGECWFEENEWGGNEINFSDKSWMHYTEKCLECTRFDYEHGSIIFNTFIFAQIFNEYTARSLRNNWDVLSDVFSNMTFIYVSLFTVGAQVFLIEVGGEFVRTQRLTWKCWLITIGLGFLGFIVGIMMRFIPVDEDPDTFYSPSWVRAEKAAEPSSKDIEMHKLPPSEEKS